MERPVNRVGQPQFKSTALPTGARVSVLSKGRDPLLNNIGQPVLACANLR
jgi:hypothetical protein